MANEEHIRILRQGVEVWNQWRENNPEIEVDLYNANLSYAELNGVNLIKAKLSKADLSYADLSHADLREAYIIEAKLPYAKLIKANLIGANLFAAKLCHANLADAILIRANLTIADLESAQLINTNLDGAELTGAYLRKTQRAGWSITGVTCLYVYWDKFGKELTNYALGEFEKLFAGQTKIKLFYKDGITPFEIATLPALIQHLEDVKDCSLRFVSITESGGGAIVELAIENTENQSAEQVKQLQEALTVEAQKLVEVQQQVLTERNERKELEGQLKELRYWFEKKLLLPTNQYNNYGQAATMGDNSQAHGSSLSQIVNADKSSVGTQIQSERNIAVADASDSSIIAGDKNRIKEKVE
jgi:hypothetical protein